MFISQIIPELSYTSLQRLVKSVSVEESITDDKSFQISSHVTEWRCDEEPKWHIEPVLFTIIQSELVITR